MEKRVTIEENEGKSCFKEEMRKSIQDVNKLAEYCQAKETKYRGMQGKKIRMFKKTCLKNNVEIYKVKETKYIEIYGRK